MDWLDCAGVTLGGTGLEGGQRAEGSCRDKGKLAGRDGLQLPHPASSHSSHSSLCRTHMPDHVILRRAMPMHRDVPYAVLEGNAYWPTGGRAGTTRAGRTRLRGGTQSDCMRLMRYQQLRSTSRTPSHPMHLMPSTPLVLPHLRSRSLSRASVPFGFMALSRPPMVQLPDLA